MLFFLRHIIIPFSCLIATNALASEVSGGRALYLSFLLTEDAPSLSQDQKNALFSLMNDRLNDVPLSVNAVTLSTGAITCKASNVIITERECAIKYSSGVVALNGRKAAELQLVLTNILGEAEGAAGMIGIGVKKIDCNIDVAGLKKRDGSGSAKCQYTQSE